MKTAQAEGVLKEEFGTSSRAKQILALTLLNIVLFAFFPIFLLKKVERTLRKKNRHELDWRRWFIKDVRPEVELAPLPGPRVVLVGPTFGEVRLIEVISKRLKAARPDINIIWCIRDLGTIELIKNAHPNQAVTIWPFDNAFPVMKWARRVRPDVVIITEKFWLPNLITVSKLFGAKMAVINGRTNRKDRFSDKVKSPYYRWITYNIDAFCIQSQAFVEQLRRLFRPGGVAIMTGNLKLDLEVSPIDVSRQEAIKAWLGTRGGLPLLAAGSTANEVDEEFVFSAFEKVRAQVPCCLLIAPRKVQRASTTAEAAKKRGYKVSMRSAPSSEAADVYVLDTLGELSYSYQFAEAAFIGGTILSTGHNVIEPVLWNKPVSYGPLRGHFEDLQLICEKFGVGFRCFTPDDLAAHWLAVLTDDSLHADLENKARTMLEHERGATQKTIDALLPIIPKS